MEPAAAARAAALLGEARLRAAQVPDIPAAERPATVADAYAVQAALTDWLVAHGQGRPAGWKIGATTAAMQTYLGVDGPACGRILSANIFGSGATLPRTAVRNPGIECEIALRMAADADAPPYDGDGIAALVAAAFPAIEIVENRYGDFLARGTPTLIADDFFHKACVVGAEAADWRALDLAALHGRTVIDGRETGSGTGADVMGHPLAAVAWLANMLAAHGLRLAANDIVLTGSLAPVAWLERLPCRATVEIEGLGDVSVEIG